jgi:hypothetical protein
MTLTKYLVKYRLTPEERKLGAAQYPTADQIRMICEAALRIGIRHLDMYGYRIGDYVIKPEDMAQRGAASPGTV